MTLTEVLAVLHAFDEAGCRYWFGQGGGEIVAIRGTIWVDEPLGENAAQHAVVEGPKLALRLGVWCGGAQHHLHYAVRGPTHAEEARSSRSAA